MKFKQLLNKRHLIGAPVIYCNVENQKPIELHLPPRPTFWVSSVERNGSDQVLDRQLKFLTDESEEQHEKIIAMMLECAGNPSRSISTDAEICKLLWNSVEHAIIEIPFYHKINSSKGMDLRTLNLFIELIRAHALIHAPVRKTHYDNGLYVTATEDDFYAANDIMSGILSNEGGSQVLNLTRDAIILLKYLELQPSGKITFAILRAETGLSNTRLSYALHGRKTKNSVENYGGLLEAVPSIEVMRRNHKDRDDSDTTDILLWNREHYLRWKKNHRFWLEPEPEKESKND